MTTSLRRRARRLATANTRMAVAWARLTSDADAARGYHGAFRRGDGIHLTRKYRLPRRRRWLKIGVEEAGRVRSCANKPAPDGWTGLQLRAAIRSEGSRDRR